MSRGKFKNNYIKEKDYGKDTKNGYWNELGV